MDTEPGNWMRAAFQLDTQLHTLIDQFTVQNQSHGPLSQGPCTLVPRQ